MGSIQLASLGNLKDTIRWYPVILIIAGVASLLIAFLGCYGAIRETLCLLWTVKDTQNNLYTISNNLDYIKHATILLVLLIIIVSVVSVSLTSKSSVQKAVRKQLQEDWDNRTAQMDLWNSMQQDVRLQTPIKALKYEYQQKSFIFTIQFKCCGLNNYTDWENAVPKSCCPDNVSCNPELYFQRGCSVIAKETVSSVINVLSTLALFEAFVQVNV